MSGSNDEISKESSEVQRKNMAYDDAGNLFIDPAGRLKDKNDKGFFLPKLASDREKMRLALFNAIRELMTSDESALAKDTYDRLRADGAGDLEARALMADVWLSEAKFISQMPDSTDEDRLEQRLALLKPCERDSAGNVKR